MVKIIINLRRRWGTTISNGKSNLSVANGKCVTRCEFINIYARRSIVKRSELYSFEHIYILRIIRMENKNEYEEE